MTNPLPILGGLGAALSWAISSLVSARASRLTGAPVTVAGAMLVGFVLLIPAALLTAPDPLPAADALVIPGLAGAANIAGLLLAYTAYRVGAVGVVSTICSTEGALAAVFAVVAGERMAPGTGPILGLLAVGVAMAAAGGGREIEEGEPIGRARSLRAAGLAAMAATMFGTGLFLTGRASGTLPLPWLLLPARVIGTLLVGVPLLLFARGRLVRAAIPYIITCGIVEVTGFTAFAIGARTDIATTSVLASMFAPIAAVAAYVLFRERLARPQVAGIAVVVAGVALLGATGVGG